jgi:hypothetical protein
MGEVMGTLFILSYGETSVISKAPHHRNSIIMEHEDDKRR